MKSEFLQPKFDGARFAEHTLPLDVAKDLAAYETLVVELAKHLYLKDHPERQRVPKGFTADFQLHLERVDEGSARPLLSLVTAGVLAVAAGDNGYFEKARDLITQCVSAPAGQLPANFPRELLAHFNQVGRSLNEDERMELPGRNGQGAVLTPGRRKALVLEAESVYERPMELAGTIIEVNWEKASFQLRPKAGQPILVPLLEGHEWLPRKYGGLPRHQAIVRGVGAYDSRENLVKVVSVDSMELQPNYELANRFDELRGLRAGWHDGNGVALNLPSLNAIAARMVEDYPAKLPLPAIVPTPEGNLLFEWNSQGDPSLDIELPTLRGELHMFHLGQEVERPFDFSQDQAWPSLFEALAPMGSSSNA